MNRVLWILVLTGSGAVWSADKPADKPTVKPVANQAVKPGANQPVKPGTKPGDTPAPVKPADAPPPEIHEEDLQRVSRALPEKFTWPLEKVAPPVPTTPQPASTDTSPFPDMSGGNIIIKFLGEFIREEKDVPDGTGKTVKKETLTLNKEVEIEQIQARSVLRGDQIRVVNDETGKPELLQGTGNVEVVTPERTGRGDALLYEIKMGPNDVTLKDLYTLEGNRTKGTKAVLWQGDDWIEADKFVNDRRLDTFRVSGGPRAVFKMPPPPDDGTGAPGATPQAPGAASKPAGNAAAGQPGAPGQPPGAPKPPAPGGGMLPGLSLSGGGKIKMQADGEMYFEGATGRLRISRNVLILQDGTPGPDGVIQGGLKMNADEVMMNMEVAPPGQPAAPNSSLFSGGLKSMECTGRVEILSPPRTVLCDHCIIDMNKKTLHLEMKNPKDDVRIYIQEIGAGGKVLVAPKSITVNMDTGEFKAAGAQRMENFTGAIPSYRSEKPADDKDAGKSGTEKPLTPKTTAPKTPAPKAGTEKSPPRRPAP